jgi:hypothetical protein
VSIKAESVWLLRNQILRLQEASSSIPYKEHMKNHLRVVLSGNKIVLVVTTVHSWGLVEERGDWDAAWLPHSVTLPTSLPELAYLGTTGGQSFKRCNSD